MRNLEQISRELAEKTKGYSPQKVLEAALVWFGEKVALASSFSVEDQVVLDMLSKLMGKPAVFTLDTGRLPQETYDVIDETRRKYGIGVEVLFPEREQVEEMVNEKGCNLFYDSIENRKLCCRVRKIEPLKRKLSKLDAWICGLRSAQSMTRVTLERVEADYNFGLIKISPIANWSREQIWEYIKVNNVPYNKLHDRGYPSIGCACCTRAIGAGEDMRSGRWWWEEPEHKECGLHLKPREETKG